MKRLVLAVGFFAALVASAEIQVINGVKYECKDGMCMPIFDDDPVAAPEVEAVRADAVEPVTRMAQGYMAISVLSPAKIGILCPMNFWMELESTMQAVSRPEAVRAVRRSSRSSSLASLIMRSCIIFIPRCGPPRRALCRSASGPVRLFP